MNRAVSHIRRHAVVYAVVACCLTAASTAGAQAASLAKNSVVSKTIKNGEVKAKDIAANAVTSAKVKDNSLTGADIDESTLDLSGSLSGYQKDVGAGCQADEAVNAINDDGSVQCLDVPAPPTDYAQGRTFYDSRDLVFDLEGGFSVPGRFGVGYLCPGADNGTIAFGNSTGTTMNLWRANGGNPPVHLTLASGASANILVQPTDKLTLTYQAGALIGTVVIDVQNNPGNCLLLTQAFMNS